MVSKVLFSKTVITGETGHIPCAYVVDTSMVTYVVPRCKGAEVNPHGFRATMGATGTSRGEKGSASVASAGGEQDASRKGFGGRWHRGAETKPAAKGGGGGST